MKLLSLILAGVFCTAAASHLQAIPQTIGGIFITANGNPRHLPIEDWFKEPAHWQLSTLPEAPWSSDTSGRLLPNPGDVFGFPASTVKVVSSEAGAIQAVVVQFSAEATKVAPSELLKRLARNVGANTGAADGKGREGQITFAGKEYTVVLEAWKSGTVIATFKR